MFVRKSAASPGALVCASSGREGTGPCPSVAVRKSVFSTARLLCSENSRDIRGVSSHSGKTPFRSQKNGCIYPTCRGRACFFSLSRKAPPARRSVTRCNWLPLRANTENTGGDRAFQPQERQKANLARQQHIVYPQPRAGFQTARPLALPPADLSLQLRSKYRGSFKQTLTAQRPHIHSNSVHLSHRISFKKWA